VKRQIAVGAFILFSLAAFFWALGSFYVFSMAEFDCADVTVDVASCARPIKMQAGVSIAVSVALWFVFAWLLSRSRSKF